MPTAFIVFTSATSSIDCEHIFDRGRIYIHIYICYIYIYIVRKRDSSGRYVLKNYTCQCSVSGATMIECLSVPVVASLSLSVVHARLFSLRVLTLDCLYICTQRFLYICIYIYIYIYMQTHKTERFRRAPHAPERLIQCCRPTSS